MTHRCTACHFLRISKRENEVRNAICSCAVSKQISWRGITGHAICDDDVFKDGCEGLSNAQCCLRWEAVWRDACQTVRVNLPCVAPFPWTYFRAPASVLLSQQFTTVQSLFLTASWFAGPWFNDMNKLLEKCCQLFCQTSWSGLHSHAHKQVTDTFFSYMYGAQNLLTRCFSFGQGENLRARIHITRNRQGRKVLRTVSSFHLLTKNCQPHRLIVQIECHLGSSHSQTPSFYCFVCKYKTAMPQCAAQQPPICEANVDVAFSALHTSRVTFQLIFINLARRAWYKRKDGGWSSLTNEDLSPSPGVR